ncbi:hypothetical protein Tco_1547151, partial [Tanacetum coccineum]
DENDGNIEDNEQLANAIQESLKLELPPRNNYGKVFPPLPWSDSDPFVERDLKSVHMESRHFRNDLYASQFQQSGSVETEGQSSSMAHKQSVTTHHLNNDPDAEQQGFLRATGTSPLHILCQHQPKFSDIHLQLQDAVVGAVTGKHQLRSRRGHHNGTTNTDTLGTVVPWHQKLLSHQQKCYDTRIAMAPHSGGSLAGSSHSLKSGTIDDDDDGNIEDNEQLANAIQESLKPELPPRNNYGNVFPHLPWERDLKSVPIESRHFRNDLYASLFQQSGSVETEGQSSSVAHKQFVTTHHLNIDPDAEQQGANSPCDPFSLVTKFSDIHLQLQDAVVGGGVPATGKHQLRSRRGHHNGTTNTDTLGTVVPWHQKLLSHQQKCYDTRIAMAPHSGGSIVAKLLLENFGEEMASYAIGVTRQPSIRDLSFKYDDDDGNIEDNEQLANAIQESLKPELPPRNNYGNVFPHLPWERDLKSVLMESRHFRNDLYASLFQQSGSVETEGTSSPCDPFSLVTKV